MKTQKTYCFFTAALLLILFLVIIPSHQSISAENNENQENQTQSVSLEKEMQYPIHKDITATVFWVGEGSSSANWYISNEESAWDENWMQSFGGEDTPEDRDGYYPDGFTPKENPFYFALPYNDFNDRGIRKDNSVQVYWKDEKNYTREESMLKNRWIIIMTDTQWEDTGPFEYDDVDYVFGTNKPKNTFNQHAGLDVSPAVRDYLKLTGIDKVDWQFVDFGDVPEGPWKVIITSS